MQRSQAPPDAAGEDEMVIRAQRDPRAFGQLYDCYVERVYRYAYRRLSSHTDAEDVTSQVFHRALEALPVYTARGSPFGAWLFRVAHNLIVDRYRTAGRTTWLDERVDGHGALADAGPAVEEQLIAAEERAAAWAAVALLPPLQRRAVTLRFARGLSHAEVSVIIGRSEAATKQLIYRAMLTLRARLGELE